MEIPQLSKAVHRAIKKDPAIFEEYRQFIVQVCKRYLQEDAQKVKRKSARAKSLRNKNGAINEIR